MGANLHAEAALGNENPFEMIMPVRRNNTAVRKADMKYIDGKQALGNFRVLFFPWIRLVLECSTHLNPSTQS
ncbi:hypothetical protein D3C73_1640430 [compost metagenome]